MEEELKNSFTLECIDECGELKFSQFKTDGEIFITYSLPAFFAYQRGIFEEIKRRLTLILHIALGKEFLFYDILVRDNSKLKAFKKYVEALEDIQEDDPIAT